jgi:pimeloyl-ACP methyl ester carboxylesterase
MLRKRFGRMAMVAAFLSLLFLLIGEKLPSPAPALAAPLPRAPSALEGVDVPRFEAAPCPVPAPDTVECGHLIVPEDHAKPEGRTLRLAIAILPSHSEAPAPDPVVYLEGGPGGSALSGLEFWLTSLFLDDRDLILLEQRGTRYAEPSLDCPELDQAYIDNWLDVQSDEEETAREVQAARQCRNRLRSEGVNLAAYNSAASAADLEALRLVLGFEEWNLYGISYGTRLALTLMRDHPTGIRSVVLDSVYPPPEDSFEVLLPNLERVFGKLFEDCASDLRCRAAYPDLESSLYDLVERTNEQPIHTPARHPETGEVLPLLSDGRDLVGELFLAFYDSSLIPFLPLVIDQVGQGNTDVLEPLTELSLQTFVGISEGMHYSVQCYEEEPFNDPAAIAAAAESIPPQLRAFSYDATHQICGIWGSGEPDPVETQPVYSDIPTLILAGEYDPITPPRSGRLAAETLSQSLFYEFPGLGHGVTASACPASIASAFVADPTSEPDTSCIDELDRPDFRTEDELYLTPVPYRLLPALLSGESSLPWILLGFSGLFLGFVIYVGLWALIWWLRRDTVRTTRAAWWFHGLLGAAAGLNLIFLVGLVLFTLGTVFVDWSLLIFGLPSTVATLFALPPLTTLLALGLLVTIGLAWKNRTASPVRRVLYTLATLVVVAFVGFLVYWDLFPF